MPLLRTRFNNDIIAEFLPSEGRDSGRVIILCDGMPTVPSKASTVRFWAKRGFWVFHPRYRGTWESGGRFLEQSPVQDIKEVIDGLHRPIVDVWNENTHDVDPRAIYVLGSSFGGTTALLASLDERVNAVVALSPVIDWTVEMEEEPLDWLGSTVKKAFGCGYRFRHQDWEKLASGNFFNPINHTEEMKGEKMLIIHGKRDPLIPWEPVREFANATDSELILRRAGGHLSASDTTGFFVSWMIRWFMRR